MQHPATVVLITFVVLSLQNIESDLVPVAYEVDGLLLAGLKKELPEIDQFLANLNFTFQQYTQRFLQKSFTLEYKFISE